MSHTDQLIMLANQLRIRRAQTKQTTADLAQAMRDAEAAGISRNEIIRVTGLAPETVRRWLHPTS